MKTLEINVGELGSELHRKVRLAIMFTGLPLDYSAGGDPYVVRIVSTKKVCKVFKSILKEQDIEFKEIKGEHGF